jgi:ribulose 1,5-bisphosphate carboxylase large subunit-like protein
MDTKQIPSGYWLAHYYLESQGDLKKAAAAIASEETTGGWVGAGEPTETFKKAQGQVFELKDLGPGKALATIAYPTHNLTIDQYMLPMMWLFMTGGPLFERMFVDTVRFMDFDLPDEMLQLFPGPKFGIDGCRKWLGLPDDELIIATIVKPCAGLTAPEVAERCRDAALGGIDFIKDDEKMANPAYCPLGEKVRLVAEGLRQAHEETGRKVIYCPHMSTRPDKIVADALLAIENGATGLMLNCFATGFLAIQMLAENPDVNVPIYVHSGGRSAWSRYPNFGIDLKVVFRLVRLLGGDFLRAHMVNGYLTAGTVEESKELVSLMRAPMGAIRDMVPALSGGLNADNLVDNLEAFGFGILPMAGGAVIDHPMGTKAGVLALRQAAESFKQGVTREDYAKTHPELAAALKKSRG